MCESTGPRPCELEAVKDRLQTLRGQFVTGLLKAHDDLGAELDALISSDRATQWDALTRTDRIAHRLAGSAGIFGFARISMAAHELQSRCFDNGRAGAEIVRAANALRVEITALEEASNAVTDGVT